MHVSGSTSHGDLIVLDQYTLGDDDDGASSIAAKSDSSTTVPLSTRTPLPPERQCPHYKNKLCHEYFNSEGCLNSQDNGRDCDGTHDPHEEKRVYARAGAPEMWDWTRKGIPFNIVSSHVKDVK